MDTHEKTIAENDYAIAMAAADLGLWRYDCAQKRVTGDSNMRKLFGLRESTVPINVWMTMVHSDDSAAIEAQLNPLLDNETIDVEYRIVRDGETRWMRTRAARVHENGKQSLLGICEETTARKSEALLFQSVAECLNSAQEAGKIAAWRWNYVSGEIAWYGSSEWIYGRPENEVDSIDKCFQFVHPDDAASLHDTVTKGLYARGFFEAETRLIWPDGSIHWMAMSARAVVSEDRSEILQVVGTNVDISERKQAENAVLLTEKLAAIGRLASSISHEINNPLAAVTNLLFIARNVPGLPPDARHYLERADLELRRVSAVSTQALRFFKQSTHAAHSSPQALISAAATLYQSRILNARITIKERHRCDRELRCLDGEIRQALNHLVSNAIDAMPSGGVLILRTRKGSEWRTGRSGICFTVADTGTGMPEEVRCRIFEAFYTTKGVGGIGIGLWLSEEIVARHSGTIRVRSKAGIGSVFSIFLPTDADFLAVVT